MGTSETSRELRPTAENALWGPDAAEPFEIA
jgi:hypothetical protein